MTTPRRLLSLITLLSLTLGGTAAMAAAPTLSSGLQLDTTTPYATAQTIGNVFANRGIYGKLQGSVPFDLYKFTADKSGEQTFTILLPQDQPDASKLTAVFVDQTSATVGGDLGLPLPAEGNYHTSVMTQSPTAPSVIDRVLLEQYHVEAQQRIALQKGQTYYIWILDPARLANRYVIVLGTGKAWSVGDFFTSFGAWWQLKTDNYAASSPFHTSVSAFGLTVLLLGLIALFGIYLIQQIFALTSNRNKAAGFLLVKLQPYSRVIIWLSLIFITIGGYIFFNTDGRAGVSFFSALGFDTAGWIGVPFILVLLFIPTLIAFLYETISLSPRVARLEVTPDEAPLPLDVRKAWYFTGFVEAVFLLAGIIYLAVYFTPILVK